MAQDITAFEAILKEVWTQDTLEKQFYAEDPLLDKIEKKFPSHTIGEKAITPIHLGRSGGYSAVPLTGSRNLNPADKQKVGSAEWEWSRHRQAIELDTAVIKQSKGSSNAVAEATELEVTGALSDMRKQLTRQAFGDGAALIAQLDTANTTNTLPLNAAGLGLHAVEAGWLYEGMTVDVGTTADEDAIAAGVTIDAVDDSPSAPTVDISGGTVSVTGSHYISIADARAGTTSYEANGLRNIVSTSAVLGGINPSNERKWKAAEVDTSTTTLTLPAIYAKQRAVKKRGGKADWALTSLESREDVYKLLQAQVRFQGDGNLAAGNDEKVTVGDTVIDAHLDCPRSDFYFLEAKRFFALRDEKPSWVSQEFGGSILHYVPGSTFVHGELEYFMQLCVNRRDVLAAFRALA